MVKTRYTVTKNLQDVVFVETWNSPKQEWNYLYEWFILLFWKWVRKVALKKNIINYESFENPEKIVETFEINENTSIADQIHQKIYQLLRYNGRPEKILMNVEHFHQLCGCMHKYTSYQSFNKVKEFDGLPIHICGWMKEIIVVPKER